MFRNEVKSTSPLDIVQTYAGADPHGAPTSATSVWHYTSAAGILGMLENDELWASAPIAMNDLSEITYGIELFVEAWARFDKASVSSDRVSFAQSLFEPPGLLFGARSFYVLSASKSGDSLNQWQGYTKGQGYAVQLATHVPLALRVPEDFVQESGFGPGSWHDVIYDQAEQFATATSVITYALDQDFVESEGGLSVSGDLFSRVTQVAARFKHPAFAAEQEVRYIQPAYPELKPYFRQNGPGIVPFVRMVAGDQFARPSSSRSQLPIVSVTLGPGGSEHRKVAQQVLVDLMISRNYLPEVKLSAVPFRP